jgi:WD40 repeat protein
MKTSSMVNQTAKQTKLIDRFNYLKTTKRRVIDCFYSSRKKMNQVNHQEEFINRKEFLKRDHRTLPTLPIKVFDAEGLVPDFYLSPLHWSQRNILAVALVDKVHLVNGNDYSNGAFQAVDRFSNYVSAVQWSDDASSLAVGTADESVQIWDPQTK